MMPVFGPASEKQLATCHPRLVLVLREAIKYFDFTVVEGHRGKAAQNAAYAKGLSQLPWPLGNHNKLPSEAADLAPYPVDWSNKAKAHFRFMFMMGVVWVCAKQLGVKVRFGFDWNRNLDPRDESFVDLPHVELDE
jgi:peptidoglycan L-alanyl-D-glutamate endopeptidase CwlK